MYMLVSFLIKGLLYYKVQIIHDKIISDTEGDYRSIQLRQTEPNIKTLEQENTEV